MSEDGTPAAANPRLEDAKSDRRRYVDRLLITLGIGLAVLVAWLLIELLVVVFGAVVVAVLLHAAAEPVSRRLGVGNHVALLLVGVAIIGILALVFWLLGAELAAQLSGLTRQLPAAWADLQTALAGSAGGRWLLDMLDQGLPSGTNVVSRLGDVLLTLGGTVADLLLIIFGSIFLAAQPQLYRRGFLKMMPARTRSEMESAMSDSGRALKLWFLGQLVSMMAIGLLTWIGLMIVGVPMALALGLIAGLLEIIPYAGPVLAALPGVLLAFTMGPETALWTVLVYALVQQAEASIVQPVIYRHSVELPPALTLFALVAAGLLFGFIGILFAAPLLVVAYVFVKRFYVIGALHTPTPIPGRDAKS